MAYNIVTKGLFVNLEPRCTRY